VKYKINSPWPVQGGAAVIPAGTIVDASVSGTSFLVGVTPPSDCTCLDQECVDVLQRAYVLAFRG
jgi:hypothetical protein